MTLCLLGDSHLARVRRSLPLLGTDVRNLAEGGSTILDVPAQLAELGHHLCHARVVSIGTNDAAPWRGVGLDTFTRAFDEALAQLGGAAVTYVAPPGVIEARLSAGALWSNSTIDRYRAAALEACSSRRIQVIRADLLVQPLGRAAFADDGVHLSGAGYRALLPAIASALPA